VFVSRLRLVNFRSYCDAAVSFGDGLNVVVGQNAAGKTNLLEGAWFALRGASPRTRREDKLITWGQRYTRVELQLAGAAAGVQTVDVAYATGQGKRARWNGVEVPSQEDLRSRSQVFIFVPESLLLVKGSPARRRSHLDVFAAALDPQYAAAARDLQAALRQRNAQLLAVKNGGAVAALDPWDVQFARCAVALGRRRRDLVDELGEQFADIATALAPAGGAFSLRLAAQLAGVGYDEDALVEELRSRRPGETSRGLSLFGPHRDDLRFLEVPVPAAAPHDGDGAGDGGAAGEDGPAGDDSADPEVALEEDELQSAASGPACGTVELPRGGRDLRLFGSQGEQRAAVLALLLAEQRLAAARTGMCGTLFLDDVMSELDDARRRLLVGMLSAAGQAIITTTNRQYFTAGELEQATVIELPLEGVLEPGAADPPADAAGPAPPAETAL
jgi:DNA replication and repair protein RecF